MNVAKNAQAAWLGRIVSRRGPQCWHTLGQAQWPGMFIARSVSTPPLRAAWCRVGDVAKWQHRMSVFQGEVPKQPWKAESVSA
jgi:hypothetical protein